jgi:hypothetical protein
MQPIENQPPALLALCWQWSVSDSDKAFPKVLCGHPTSAGQGSPKRTAPLNLRESLTPNVRLRLKQGHFPLAHAGDPTPANWIGQILHHGTLDCNSLLRLLSFSWIDSVCRRAYFDNNKPVTPLVRTAHQGGCFFAAIPLFACFVYFVVPIPQS